MCRVSLSPKFHEDRAAFVELFGDFGSPESWCAKPSVFAVLCYSSD